MTDSPKQQQNENITSKNQEPPTHVDANTTYLYPSSGISERYGAVPLWLQLVAVCLVIWAVAYLVMYL